MAKFFRYDLPSVKGEGWCTVVMCSDGYFSTVSDWGSYAFWWSNFGERDFRTFLLGCDADYIRRKLNPARVFDDDATTKKLREYVCRARRRRKIDDYDARRMWHDANVTNDLEFWDWIREFSAFKDALPNCYVEEVPKDRPDSDIMGFVTYLLPRIQDAIRTEMEREKEGAQQPDHRREDGERSSPGPR